MNKLIAQVRRQLKEARESVWARYPLPTQFPSFRTAPQASQHVLSLFGGPILVARDPSLRPMRQAAHLRRTLVLPDRAHALYQVPATASVLRLDGLPALAYRGPIDAVVVACLAFDPLNRWLYGFDSCQTGGLLAELDDLPARPVVVCLASDSMQVSGWPASAEAHQADVVVTATRLIRLGSGETEMW